MRPAINIAIDIDIVPIMLQRSGMSYLEIQAVHLYKEIVMIWNQCTWNIRTWKENAKVISNDLYSNANVAALSNFEDMNAAVCSRNPKTPIPMIKQRSWNNGGKHRSLSRTKITRRQKLDPKSPEIVDIAYHWTSEMLFVILTQFLAVLIFEPCLCKSHAIFGRAYFRNIAHIFGCHFYWNVGKLLVC